MRELMACGHTANATCDGKPYCVICGCGVVSEEKPSLEGRQAKCAECGKIMPSDYNLPFFEYCENKPYDSYYCGCWGWD